MSSAQRPTNHGTKGPMSRYKMSYNQTKYFLSFVKKINPQGASAWELLKLQFNEWLVKVDGYQGKLPDDDALKKKWAAKSGLAVVEDEARGLARAGAGTGAKHQASAKGGCA